MKCPECYYNTWKIEDLADGYNFQGVVEVTCLNCGFSTILYTIIAGSRAGLTGRKKEK
jgi:hypothetical protein